MYKGALVPTDGSKTLWYNEKYDTYNMRTEIDMVRRLENILTASSSRPLEVVYMKKRHIMPIANVPEVFTAKTRDSRFTAQLQYYTDLI
jgi:hypothetical protein